MSWTRARLVAAYRSRFSLVSAASMSVAIARFTFVVFNQPEEARQMYNRSERTLLTAPRIPWNKGKLIGQKPPLQPKHIWAIRTNLQRAKKLRDLCLFNVAIDRQIARV